MTFSQPAMAYLDSALHDKSQQLIRLEHAIRAFLPSNLTNEIYIGNLHGQGSHSELVLLVQHSAIATRIRQSLPSLLTYLQSKGWGLANVRIKIHPGPIVVHQPKPPTTPKHAVIGNTGIHSLLKLHAQLSPSPAREALAVLLGRLK
jgi:hypothetical protein